MSEDSWVFDSLVCFLHGPVWNAALQTFIEEKSLIFDPNEEIDVENPEFSRIYNEYKNLVDFMLGSFMTELSITPEQFEFACMEGKNLNILPSDESHVSRHSFSFHQGLFQQIWAANDIRIFIRMMTQRNMELQLQALDLIERQASTHSKDEIEVPSHDTQDFPEIKEDREPTDKETEEITRSVELELHGDHLTELPTEDEQSDKFKRLNLFFDSERIRTADVETRQEYLRSQRDKILKIKKQARARQLNETVKKTGRPSSAQMAQKFLDGEADVALEPSSSGAAQLRQTLAKRLRNEVVDGE